MSDVSDEETSTYDDEETESVVEKPYVADDSTLEDDIWDVILDDTVKQYNDQLQKHIEDADVLKRKFEKYFFENARKWVSKLYNFYEQDEVFGKILEFIKNVDHADDDEEALNLAVDNKKYKLLKVIDWARVFSLIGIKAEESDEAEDEETAVVL